MAGEVVAVLELEFLLSALLRRTGGDEALGPGIAQDLLASLFSPVKTTKGDAHQGLGLNIVLNLVKNSNGLISCRSSARGTVVEILLPTHTRPIEKTSRGLAK